MHQDPDIHYNCCAIYAAVYFMPVKMAKLSSQCDLKDGYYRLIPEAVTGANWYARGKDKVSSNDVFLEGISFEDELKPYIVWSEFYVKGYYSNNEDKYEGLKEAEVRTLYVESWDIVAPIIDRDTLLRALFFPRYWLIKSDFISKRKNVIPD